MTSAKDHIRDTLDRAQKSWDATICIGSTDDPPTDRIHVAWFIHHVTTAVLLEHLRRADPELADRLVTWMLTEDGIFSDCGGRQDGDGGGLMMGWPDVIALVAFLATCVAIVWIAARTL